MLKLDYSFNNLKIQHNLFLFRYHKDAGVNNFHTMLWSKILNINFFILTLKINYF